MSQIVSMADAIADAVAECDSAKAEVATREKELEGAESKPIFPAKVALLHSALERLSHARNFLAALRLQAAAPPAPAEEEYVDDDGGAPEDTGGSNDESEGTTDESICDDDHDSREYCPHCDGEMSEWDDQSQEYYCYFC